ncbi:hypothetical protein DFH09DRAFT_1072268 [Mycena vulgaris]|nr:hypothetical protein DFH09DRAFT_1072268 [Mycena vulgaris]
MSANTGIMRNGYQRRRDTAPTALPHPHRDTSCVSALPTLTCGPVLRRRRTASAHPAPTLRPPYTSIWLSAAERNEEVTSSHRPRCVPSPSSCAPAARAEPCLPPRRRTQMPHSTPTQGADAALPVPYVASEILYPGMWHLDLETRARVPDHESRQISALYCATGGLSRLRHGFSELEPGVPHFNIFETFFPADLATSGSAEIISGLPEGGIGERCNYHLALLGLPRSKLFH